jgi:hypothetical protein
VLIRPEQVEVEPDGPAAAPGEAGCLAGRVVAYGYHGHDAVIRVEPDPAAGTGQILARTAGGRQLPPGAPVRLRARGPVLAWPGPAAVS